MNCKPDDIARVVAPAIESLRGQYVRIVRAHGNNCRDTDGERVIDNGPRWVIDPPLPCFMRLTRRPTLAYTLPDSHLRPIDNPGDDAVDETLLWKPKEEVHPTSAPAETVQGVAL